LLRQDTIHNKFLAVAGLDVLDDFPYVCNAPQSCLQRPGFTRIEPQRLEKVSLAAIVWMRPVQPVLSLASIDDREVRISQLHAEPIVSWTALESLTLEAIHHKRRRSKHLRKGCLWSSGLTPRLRTSNDVE
jgi:hypothetical protein